MTMTLQLPFFINKKFIKYELLAGKAMIFQIVFFIQTEIQASYLSYNNNVRYVEHFAHRRSK